MGREVTGSAARAHASFTAGKYDEALSHLSQLVASGAGDSGEPGGDFRTLHNRALCEHGCTGFTDPARLEESLHAIQAQIRGKSRSDGAADDGEQGQSALMGAAALIGSTGGAAAASVGLGDFDADASVLLFNLSALHFQQKHYGAAQAVLEHLFLHIEPLDDSLAIHVCFLLLDVLCHSARGNLHTEANLRRFSQQSSAVVAYLERTHALNSTGGGDGGGGGDTRHDDAGGVGGGGSSSLGGSGEQTEFAFRLHLYKAKILLLKQQTKTSKKEIKSALEIFQRELRGSNDGTGGGPGGGSSGGQHGQQQGTFAPVPAPGVQNMAALYLKANLEHLRDNHRKALKLLASCHGFQGAEEYSGPGEAVGPPYFNNMGCLHHKLRRHHVALHYFQKALEALGRGSAAKENGAPPSGRAGGAGGGTRGGGRASRGDAGGGAATADGHMSPAPTCEILYNTGLQLLLTDKPQEALRCFERAALLFHNRPHLWLRMAECSIADHRLRHVREGRSVGVRIGASTPPPSKTPSGAGGDVKEGPGGGAGVPGAGTGVEAHQRERRPLPWRSVGAGQHRRVLLPTTSRMNEDDVRVDRVHGVGGSAIPPLEDESVGSEANGSSATSAGGSSFGGAGGSGTLTTLGGREGDPGVGAAGAGGFGGGRGRDRRAGVGCSLAHASRCLHNVMYLCAAHAQGAKQSVAPNPTGLLGGQPGVLGVSPRLMAKNLSVSQSGGGHANASSGSAGGGGAGGLDSGGDGDGDGDGEEGGGGRDGVLGAMDGTGEIYQVALVDLAYVHLGLNDPVTTLAFTGRLLANKTSVVNQHLAHLYAAEALCILGRSAEALEHLTPLSEETATAAAAAGAWASAYRRPGFAPIPASGSVGALSSGTGAAGGSVGVSMGMGPGSGGAGVGVASVETVTPEAMAESRASLHANLAAVHALQDNLPLAERCARIAMGICPGSVSVLRIAVYVLIRRGNVAEALQVLKEGRLSRK